MSDEGVHVQRGLSEWWSEESEYLLQRIERWAALARGYNRLRSHNFSKGRLADEGLDEDENNYMDYELRRSSKNRSPETRKLNCCGGFNYQSNSKLDSHCLETYRYDHSIYFKTIGDIRRSKSGDNVRSGQNGGCEQNEGRGQNGGCEQDGGHCSDEEKVEWDVRVVNNSLTSRNCTMDRQMVVMQNGEVRWDYLDKYAESDGDNNRIWPVVDGSELATEEDCLYHDDKNHQDDQEREDARNNNVAENFVSRSESEELKQQSMTRILSFRTKPKVVRRPMVCGENNVSWPGVLLSYTSSYVDPAVASSHNRVVKVK